MSTTKTRPIDIVPEADYAPHGGCFPVFIKGSGLMGTITVSGLSQEDDHQLVVDVIRDYLKKESA